MVLLPRIDRLAAGNLSSPDTASLTFATPISVTALGGYPVTALGGYPVRALIDEYVGDATIQFFRRLSRTPAAILEQFVVESAEFPFMFDVIIRANAEAYLAGELIVRAVLAKGTRAMIDFCRIWPARMIMAAAWINRLDLVSDVVGQIPLDLRFPCI